MKILQSASAILLATVLVTPTFAGNDHDHGHDKKNAECTESALAAARAYDIDMVTATTCIKKRDDVEVIVAWNNNGFNGKIFKTSGATVGQQIVNVRNLARDYEINYDMSHGDDFSVVVVAYASGIDWLKNTTDPANQKFIRDLQEKGIKIFACQNTMKAKDLKLVDLVDGIETVPAGVTAVVDFQLQGRTLLVP